MNGLEEDGAEEDAEDMEEELEERDEAEDVEVPRKGESKTDLEGTVVFRAAKVKLVEGLVDIEDVTL